MDWQLMEAESHFAELLDSALSEGPQRVVGKADAVIVMAEFEYQQLRGTKQDFREFLLGEGPDFGGLDLARDPSTPRDAGL